MPKRNLTVGVTVNLKNYESLRLEVQDEVESEEDVRSLVAFLDETLALFGRGNRETEDLVAHYRRRVLEGAAGRGRGGGGCLRHRHRPPRSRPPRPAEAPAVEPPAPEPVAAEPPEEARHRRPRRRPHRSPPPKAPAKVPAPSPTGAVCEECGAPVSAAEEKTSRLFVSRTLCKKCIQTL